VFEWVQPFLREDQRAPLKQLLDRAKVDTTAEVSSPSTMTELQPADAASQSQKAEDKPAQPAGDQQLALMALFAGVALLLLLGFLRGRYGDGMSQLRLLRFVNNQNEEEASR
jgi:hypothetical protein